MYNVPHDAFRYPFSKYGRLHSRQLQPNSVSPLIKALDKVGEFNRLNVRFCVSQPDNTHHIYLLRHGSGFIAFECKPGRTFPNLTGTIVLCTTNDAAEIILVGCTHNMARETLEDINIILFGKAKQDRPLHN